MATPRQIAANRRNALRSTGPRTVRGKSQARRNALRHGLTAQTIISRIEDEDDYRKFEGGSSLSITHRPARSSANSLRGSHPCFGAYGALQRLKQDCSNRLRNSGSVMGMSAMPVSYRIPNWSLSTRYYAHKYRRNPMNKTRQSRPGLIRDIGRIWSQPIVSYTESIPVQ